MLTYTIWPLTTSLIASFSFLAHFFYPSHTDFRILPQGCQEHGQLGPLILFLLPGYLFSHMPTRPTNPLCWWMFSFHFSKKLSFLLATSPEYREALANAIHLKNKKQANKQTTTNWRDQEGKESTFINHLLHYSWSHSAWEKCIVSFNPKATLKVE